MKKWIALLLIPAALIIAACGGSEPEAAVTTVREAPVAVPTEPTLQEAGKAYLKWANAANARDRQLHERYDSAESRAEEISAMREISVSFREDAESLLKLNLPESVRPEVERLYASLLAYSSAYHNFASGNDDVDAQRVIAEHQAAVGLIRNALGLPPAKQD